MPANRSRAFVTGESLHIEGLSESIKALREIDKTLPRVVSKVSRDLTKKVMLPKARGNWRAQRTKPSLATKAVKATATQSGAALKLMYANVPVAAGVEFGAKRFKQFRPWRGNRFTVAPGSSTGYVVQDAIRDNLDDFAVQWQRDVWIAMDKALKSFGL